MNVQAYGFWHKALAFTLLTAAAIPGTAFSEDLNWLQPGVRAWYVGGGAETDAEVGCLIKSVTNGVATVRKHSAGNHWQSPAGTEENPFEAAKEGEFWIHPSRLAPLKVGGRYLWKGLDCVVRENRAYTFAELPYVTRKLPQVAMYAAISPRTTRRIVRMTSPTGAGSEFMFDVETGLLLSYEQTSVGVSVYLDLAEINYDFVRHRAFPEEKNVPHTGFGATYSAWRSLGFGKGDQGAMYTIDVLSRMRGAVMIKCKIDYNDSNSWPVSTDEYLIYDSDRNVALRLTDVENGTWTGNGSHFCYWIPPADCALDSIRVWDYDLPQKASSGAGTMFYAATAPPAGGFQALVFSNSSGYMEDFVVWKPDYGSSGFYVDSRLDPNATALTWGDNYYRTTMRQGLVTPGAQITLPARTEQKTGSNTPLHNQARTLQYVLDSSLLGFLPIGAEIGSMAFRLDGGGGSWPAAARRWEHFDVQLSTSASPPGSLSTTFRNNIGSDVVTVRSGPLAIPPAAYSGGTAPNDFGTEIPFTTPFIYRGGDLLITIRHTGNGTACADVDAAPDLAGVLQGIHSTAAGAYSAATANGGGNVPVTRLTYATPPSPEIAVEQPAGTQLTDNTGQIAFGSLDIGSTTATKTFTIRNVGTANLSGIVINKAGGNPGDYWVSGPATSTLAPGASITFTVTFKPAAAGGRTAAIHIRSNDSDENPFDIVLSGSGLTAPEIVVKQPAQKNLKDGSSAVSFGTVAVKKAVSKTFTIRNTGSAKLSKLAVTINGRHAKDFIVGKPAKTSLSPGGSTTFKVTFKPRAAGTRKAAIHIRSNDANENPFDIKLQGKGKAKAARTVPEAATKAAALAATLNLADERQQPQAKVSTVRLADGTKYLSLNVIDPPADLLDTHLIEVSPNLVDWFSGSRHTTVMRNAPVLLKVRDNTPLTPEVKRHIRIRSRRISR